MGRPPFIGVHVYDFDTKNPSRPDKPSPWVVRWRVGGAKNCGLATLLRRLRVVKVAPTVSSSRPQIATAGTLLPVIGSRFDLSGVTAADAADAADVPVVFVAVAVNV
jgi:hypothetical protein